MIIFDLDGTLANIDHRRHFVDPSKDSDVMHGIMPGEKGPVYIMRDYYKSTGKLWKPDWRAFYDACDNDEPNEAVCSVFDDLAVDNEIEIWSGRCESIKEKTINWLYEYGPYCGQKLKMRSIGDSTPDDQLKEKWLDIALKEGKTIEYVFDDRPKVIRMWRRRGIFVFNCCQHDEEF